MFMASARPHPLDSNRPPPVPKSRAQIPDAPDQRLFFILLLKTLLAIGLAHPTLTREARDRITGMIRALIERLEQQRSPAPSADPAQTSQHRRTAAIRTRASRNRAPTARRKRRPRAEPAAPRSTKRPHCASANQVCGPPRRPSQHQHPALRPPA